MAKTIIRRKAVIILIAACALVCVCLGETAAQRRPVRRGAIVCGNPNERCRTSVTFQPHDLPFRVPQNAVIYETEQFYAVILKSLHAKDENCDLFVSETERLAAQALFPDNKVFTSRCPEPGDLFYKNVKEEQRIMAVFAGRTLAEARAMLEQVKATGKFPGANLRRMQTGFNGT